MNAKTIFLLSSFLVFNVLNGMEKEEEIDEIEVVVKEKPEPKKLVMKIPKQPEYYDSIFLSGQEDERCCNWCIEVCFPSNPQEFLEAFYQYRTVQD